MSVVTEQNAPEKINYKGWPNCLRLTNGEMELVVTTDVGPRIMRLGFVGGQNLLKNVEEEMGKTGGAEWIFWGGHRLWHAPEESPRTYAPDNDPVAHEWDGRTLTLKQKTEVSTGIEKWIMITLDPARNQALLRHRLINRNPWTVELAPWALSVMAPGGRAIFPQEEYRPHPDYLAAARPLVLWYYTDMSDPRWSWGPRYIQLRQDPQATTKTKVGLLNKQGWCAYQLGGDLLIKRYGFDPKAVYADYGCNTETFTMAEFLEVETLGPLTRLEPDAQVDHDERWLLAKVDCGESEDEIERKIRPLAEALSLA